MNLIANVLIREFLKRDIIDGSMKDMYREGLILIIADIINISVILLIGFCIGKPIYALLFLSVFWVVRWFAGGYHAKTYWLCRLTTISSFIVTIIIGELFRSKMQYLTIWFVTITFLTIVLFAPIKHPNKELSDQVRNLSKKIASVIVTVLSVCSYILCTYTRMEGFIVSITLFVITMLMYAGILFNGRGGGKNE